MIGILVRAAGLTAVYLMVLSSVKWGDIAIGAALGLVLAWALRPSGERLVQRRGAPPLQRMRAAAGTVAQTAAEMARGTWRTARFCLRAGRGYEPGMVEIPREGRSRRAVAMWGVLTGEAPDEIPVDVDEERDVLIVHLIDASDPDGVRARHHEARQRWQSKVVD